MKQKRNNYGVNPETGERFAGQYEVLAYYLKEKPGRKITSLEAITEFGFTRLSGVVKYLEYRTGIRLERKKIIVPTRYGGAVPVMQYWMPETTLFGA